MGSATLKETCSCGATLDYTGSYPNTVSTAWRRDHKHTTTNGVLVVPEGMSLCKSDETSSPASGEGSKEKKV